LNSRSEHIIEMSSNATIAALEQRYIELLEKIIAKLESADDSKEPKTPSLVSDFGQCEMR